MAQKHTWPRQKVTVKITQAQADLILENDPVWSKNPSGPFSDQNRPVDGHRRQPCAQLLKPAQAAVAHGEHEHPALGRGRLRRDCGQAFEIFDHTGKEYAF